jgi:hypothetical protein
MSKHIHARKTLCGLRYRLWCTEHTGYVTQELTDEAVREELLSEAQTKDPGRLAALKREIDSRMNRANVHGTSGYLKSRDMQGPWDEEVRDYDFM